MKKNTLRVFIWLVIMLLSKPTLYAQVLFSEDFESQFLPNTSAGPNAPAGWTQTRGYDNEVPSAPGTDGPKDWAQMVWTGTDWRSNTLPNINQLPYPVTTPALIPPAPITGTGVAWFNDANSRPLFQFRERTLYSPVIDLTNADIAVIKLDYFFRSSSSISPILYIQLSNDGTNYSYAHSIPIQNSSNWQTIEYVIPLNYKTASFKMGITIQEGNTTADFWLDNIKIVNRVPQTVAATATGGNWSDGNSWVGGSVPFIW